MIVENKLCENCSKTIKGRSDKKFCNDYCRNSFNNNINASSNNLVRRVNLLLGKNRRILASLFYPSHYIIKIKKEILIQKGYYFKYTTGFYKSKGGTIFCYCYDFTLLSINEDFFIIIKERNN